MNSRTIGLIALCAALAACNSKPAETTAASTNNMAGPAVATSAPTLAPVLAKPAPEGLPSRIAKEVIAAGGQKCEGVVKAERNAQDGTIIANCSSGESYRVYTEEGKGPVATAL